MEASIWDGTGYLEDQPNGQSTRSKWHGDLESQFRKMVARRVCAK